jgi:FkbH-like protein
MLSDDTAHLDYFALVREAKRLDRSRCTVRRTVAVLADCSTQHLQPVLEALFARAGIDATVHLGEFDTIEQEILDPSSALYAVAPDCVVLLQSTSALRDRYFDARGDRTGFAAETAARTVGLWDTLAARLPATVVQSTYVRPQERVFGNYDLKVPESLGAVIMALNATFAEQARARPQVLLADIDAIASWVGRRSFFDERLWALAKAPCGLEHLPLIAQSIVDVIASTVGRGVKCVVVDLDNTLWGGVIGDDGLDGIVIGHSGDGEPFVRVQQFLRELSRRGILLAVCSKNEDAAARQPFREHPEMVLREDDFALFVANWNTKADNLRGIQQQLNIGLDSIVFLDDNPFERNLVRRYLPEVIVPELPEEPAEWVRALAELNLFETSSFTAADRERGALYRQAAARETVAASFTNVGEYLQSLDMKIAVRPFDAVQLPRIAQLIQRSNQFNLTTRRYGAAECEALMRDAACTPLYVSLEDRFGDYGLISVVVAKHEQDVARLDLWLMSCRVLSRGVEEFTMNRIVELARARGARQLLGEYIPTAKNRMVQDFYGRFGFRRDGVDETTGSTRWVLDIPAYEPKTTFMDEVRG